MAENQIRRIFTPMIPGLSFFERIPNKWIRCNAQYTLVGILIGLFVNIIFRITAGFSFSWPDTVMTFVVSVIITLCITNISLISGDIIKRKFTSPWQNVIINYLLIFLGVIIGTELSMLVFSAIYDIPFAEIDQAENLRRNLSIGFLAGTVLYIYQLQSDNYNLKINEQELQLSKLKEMKTQSDLRTLQARINPHFLYNALNSITSLIHDEPGKAEEMTIKLSQLFRYSINNSESNLVRVREELHVVNLYLDIERVRFGDRIAFDVQAGADTLDALIPRFLLQPLVENALKHGLKQTGSGGLLRVAIARQGDRILISVHDNGIPFPKDMLAGYGMQSTFDKLNLVYGDAWKLEWINEPEKMIRLELPLNVPVLSHA